MNKALILALILAPVPVLAAERPAPRVDVADRNKVVCIKQYPTGTRFPKRTCKTAADWEQERQEARQMLEKAVNTQLNPVG